MFWPSLHDWDKILWPSLTWGEKLLRPIVVYIVLLVAFRLSGKREMGQFSPFDFLIVVVIADAVQNGMVGEDNSLFGNLTSALVLIGVSVILDRLTYHSVKVQAVIEPGATLLVYKGKIIEQNLRKETVSRNELLSVLRQNGIACLSEVRYAILESESKISIIRSDAAEPDSTTDDTITEEIAKQAPPRGEPETESTAPGKGGTYPIL